MRAQKVGTSGRRKAGAANGADARFNAARFFLTRDNNGKILPAKTTPIDRRFGNIDVQIPAATPKRIDGPQSGTYFGWIYGIGTYSAPLSVATQGNYGDIIGVDLQELVTKKILGLENTPLADWNAAQLAAYGAQLNKLGNFSLDQSVIDSFTAKEGASLPPMQLVTKEAKGKEVYSRMYTNGPTPAEFKDSGVLYLAPTITEQDETNLRAGKKIDTKPAVTLSFWYGEKNAAGVFEQKQGTVSVTANDIKEVNTFFGDRPLDNPGYSKFELKGEVKADSTSNDVLDVFRVEQRLKYFGFPAMSTNNPTTNNTLQPFGVDGNFTDKERAALKLFEKVVRYGGVGSVGTETTTLKKISVANRYDIDITFTVTVRDGAAEPIVWNTEKITPNAKLTGADKAAALAEAQAALAAKKDWVQGKVDDKSSGTYQRASAKYNADVSSSRRFNEASTGADGLIEASGAQAVLTTNWLNAYNAPHWMDIGLQMQYQPQANGTFAAQAGNSIPGWVNRTWGVEKYGTSWMRDLMAAAQYAPDALRGDPVYDAQGNITGYTPRNTFWFNAAVDANLGKTPKGDAPVGVPGGIHKTHDLGMAFDLGVSGYIDRNGAQTDEKDLGNTAEMQTALNDAMQTEAAGWSVSKANKYASKLVNIVGSPTTLANEQATALRDFLSLYALTQESDGQAGLDGHIVNTTAANLFGGQITQVHIGSADKGNSIPGLNSYPRINAILGKLGIKSSAVDPHHHHFHIYLKPPTPEQIGPAHLLADAATALAFDLTVPAPLQSEAQGIISYTRTLIEGEELMFIMDVPVIPAQETLIVLAQADTAIGATPQPDYILNYCKETEHGDPRSAMHAVDPAYMLTNYLNSHSSKQVVFKLTDIKNITLLQDATVGKITSVIDNTGRPWYRYDAPDSYVGKDKAVFQAEFEGKVYKIVVELHVFLMVNEYEPSSCPPPKLIKVKKPSTPSTGVNGYDLNSITVTFADLQGAAIGQTTGSTITLDDNASGYNWYIDPTPGQNEEYLPTSNPNEWVAKAGSAAYGKMDMLSVLLHEYGHALGINHSPDPNDYMGATLTAGVRRLPSAEEMALMQGLVAQAKDSLTPPPLPGGEGQSSVGRASARQVGINPDLPNNNPLPLPIPLGTTFIGFLGLLRSSRYGGVSIVPDESTLVTQHEPHAFVGLDLSRRCSRIEEKTSG